jgi:hypothetical protein
MAECFCGCGRKIGFLDRKTNRQAKRIAELQAERRPASRQCEGPVGAGRSTAR